MNKTIKKKKGFYYTNDVWFSPAYQSLSNATRDLLQCMLTEFRRKKVKVKSDRFSKEWVVINNNEDLSTFHMKIDRMLADWYPKFH